MTGLRLVADALTAAVFASHCAACDVPLDTPTAGAVCPACWAAIRPVPPCAGEYDGSLRRIIHAFKYDGRRSLARPLGALMRVAGRDVLAGADCVVPVPLHPWRWFRRGFNQASLLAAELERPVIHAVWRTRWTQPQAGLDRQARARNIRGAFRVSPVLRRQTVQRYIAGRAVVLVDDVRTTGATLEACAEVLHRAGAAEVRVLTAARARYRNLATVS